MKRTEIRICRECLGYLQDSDVHCPSCGEPAEARVTRSGCFRRREAFSWILFLLFAVGWAGGGCLFLAEAGVFSGFRDGVDPIALVVGLGMQLVAVFCLFLIGLRCFDQ